MWKTSDRADRQTGCHVATGLVELSPCPNDTTRRNTLDRVGASAELRVNVPIRRRDRRVTQNIPQDQQFEAVLQTVRRECVPEPMSAGGEERLSLLGAEFIRKLCGVTEKPLAGPVDG